MLTAQTKTSLRRWCLLVEHGPMRRCPRVWNQKSQPAFSHSQQRLVFTGNTQKYDDAGTVKGGRAFISGEDEGSNAPQKERLWIDPESSLDENVNAFLEAPPGDLHRLDVHLYAHDLITESCKLGTLDGLQQAQAILNRILLEKRVTKGMMIAGAPFEALIYGWVRKADATSPAKMIELLRLMETEHQYDLDHFESSDGDVESSSESSCAPTTETYNTILIGLARAAERDIHAALTADNLVDEMIRNFKTRGCPTKPNNKTFTHLLKAHGNTRLTGAADHAERILMRVKAIHQEEKQAYETKFANLILAIVNSKVKNASERAWNLLFEQLDAGSKVSAHAFNTVIFGLANETNRYTSPKERYEAALRAEELAMVLFEKHADLCIPEVSDGADQEEIEAYWKTQLTIALNVAISAWARADVSEAAPRAQELFQLMVESPFLKPDAHSVNVTLKALARSGNPGTAEELLNLINKLIDTGDLDSHCKPDLVSYCTVMSAWAKSQNADKAQQAKRILSEMMSKYEAGDMSTKPNMVAFTTILNAVAHTDPSATDDAEEAYRIALDIYDAILTDAFGLDLHPDYVFFSCMLKVVNTHTDRISTERRQMVERVFDDACAAGQVSTCEVFTFCRQLATRVVKGVPNHPRFRNVDRRSGQPSKAPNARHHRG
ncbi:endonuclease [Fragilaria crotonensis]|nr:endonuclease [Fragilaria crotonensis]